MGLEPLTRDVRQIIESSEQCKLGELPSQDKTPRPDEIPFLNKVIRLVWIDQVNVLANQINLALSSYSKKAFLIDQDQTLWNCSPWYITRLLKKIWCSDLVEPSNEINKC